MMNNQIDMSRTHSTAVNPANIKVIQQTYLLLAVNVLFSAFCAYVGMKLNIRIPFFVAFLGIMAASVGITRFRNSGVGIAVLFAFTGFLGLYISSALSALYGAGMGSVVVKALVGSAIIFSALSAYVLFTGTNFNFLGGFLFVGAIVVMLAGIGASLFNMTALAAASSAGFLLISSGYILYSTSQIIRGEQTNYIIATMDLFMSLFNLFVSLLNLLTIFSGRD